ncbi:MAG: hydroxyacylglutathione hydrolase [Betaproteobacteria bacterium]
MAIEPIPAFADNYIWLLTQGDRAAVVDPGDAAPVLDALRARQLRLAAILVTHHHGDHGGGVPALATPGVPVYGPAGETIPGRTHALVEGDAIEVLGTEFQVLDVPGHTGGHIAYYARDMQALFCGDTLFAAGCGRLFEGTPAQMVGSLAKLAALPPATRVYCAHEYTLANLRFARAVEPDNAALAARSERCAALRASGTPTVPSTLAEELATNPFLRCEVAAVRAAAERIDAGTAAGPVATFAALRAWKNRFS